MAILERYPLSNDRLCASVRLRGNEEPTQLI